MSGNWHASDRQNRNRHPDVLKDVGENESSDSDDEQKSELIAGTESNEEAGQQEQGESAEQKHAADKSPLFADGGKNVIVVHRGSGQKTELDLRIGRFEPFAGPAAGANRDERLIDCPGRTLAIDVGIDECSDPFLLVRLKSEIDRDRNKSDHDQNDANQITHRNSADEKQRHQDRSPDDALAQIRLHQNEQTGRTDDRAAQRQTQHRMHLPELAEKKRQHHDPGDDGELRGLEIHRTEMEPAARAVNLLPMNLVRIKKTDRRDTSAARPSGPSGNRSGS